MFYGLFEVAMCSSIHENIAVEPFLFFSSDFFQFATELRRSCDGVCLCVCFNERPHVVHIFG